MRVLRGHSDLVALFVATQLPVCFPDPGDMKPLAPCEALGMINDAGQLIGGFVYHDWRKRLGIVEVSVACIDPKGLTKNILRELLEWPFQALGVRKIVAHISDNNTRSLTNCLRMGFNREALLLNYYGPGDHAAECGFYREDLARISAAKEGIE